MSGKIDDHLGENMRQSPKKAKIRYTRELLLSLNELEICNKLPTGFDRSLLSEFEDTSNSIPERPRLPGSLSSQNFRRIKYGVSPPTRGDIGNSSRATQGRWDTRSSGSNDRDSDSQIESETEDRSVLHVALRAPRDKVLSTDGKNVVPDVWKVLDKINEFSEKIRSGSWVGATGKPLTDVVAVGIDGNFLSPLFVHTALQQGVDLQIRKL